MGSAVQEQQLKQELAFRQSAAGAAAPLRSPLCDAAAACRCSQECLAQPAARCW